MGRDNEDELFEAFDDEGRQIGLRPRSVVHATGVWHRSVNVIVLRPNGEMLLQRRSVLKDVCPDVWDLSVAEHLKPGEAFADAACRGLEEELSLRDIELVSVGTERSYKLELREEGVRDFELQRLFVGVTDAAPVADSEEVADVRYISLDKVREIRSRSPAELTPWLRAWLDATSDEAILAALRAAQSAG